MATRPLTIKRISGAVCGLDLLWMVVCTFLLHYIYNVTWEYAAVDSLVSNFLLALCCIAISNLLGYYQPKQGTTGFILLVSLVLTLSWGLVCRWLFQHVSYPDQAYRELVLSGLLARSVVVYVMIAWTALASVLWYKLEEQDETLRRQQEMESMAKEAELHKLRQQLQPHFLFNSLNSINALVLSNPEEASKMVNRLSTFLRGTLKKEDQQWIGVDEEMQYLQLYLDIEKVRFGHRLHTEIKLDDSTTSFMIPAMLLQPLVENAIKFGLYGTIGTITINIDLQDENGMLSVRISNPFDEDSAPEEGTGFGLNAIKRRLYLLFGQQDLLQTEAQEHIFITTLKIPQPHDKSNHN